MKRLLCIIIGVILFIPFSVNAETLTYNVCPSGCEYNRVNSIDASSAENKDIIINVSGNVDGGYVRVGNENNKAKSLTIIGDNARVFGQIRFYVYTNSIKFMNISLASVQMSINSDEMIFESTEADRVYGTSTIKRFTANNLNGRNWQELNIEGLNQVIVDNSKLENIYLEVSELNQCQITNSNIASYMFINTSSNAKNFNDIWQNIDNNSKDAIKVVGLNGDFIIKNIDLSNKLLSPSKGTINIYNSKLEKIFTVPIYPDIDAKINVHNSTFKSLKYKRLLSFEDFELALEPFDEELNVSGLEEDIYDIQFDDFNIKSFTTVFFDKILKIKINDKIDLTSYLDYYTDDKEISYTIDDENIAKIENKELLGLKAGNTKVVVTTDEGHVIYNIDLTVEPTNSGIIEKKEQGTKNYAQADFSSEDLNSIIPLTSDEQAIKESGKNIEVFLEVKDISSNISSEDQKMIDSKLETNEVLGAYLDVSLFKQAEGQDATKIEETNGNIKVSMKLPGSLLNKDKSKLRTYYILRLHNGVVDKLDTVLNGDTLSFETNKFSTYALVYEDINNPPTGDNIIKYIGILFVSILLIVFMLVSKLRKE